MRSTPPVGLVGSVARLELRRRWRSYVGLIALLGVVGGLSLFCIAGARRTQSSYARFTRAARVSTMFVTSTADYDSTAVAALPQVTQSRRYFGLQINVLVNGRPDFAQAFEATGTFDGEYFDQDRFTATVGRRPDPTRADEVAFDEAAATRYGYHVGQRLTLATYDFAAEDAAFFANPTPPKVTTSVTVVGIGRYPDEVVQDDGDRVPRLLLTPAFTRASAAYVTYSLQALALRNGERDVAAVKAAIVTGTPGASFAFRVTSVDATHALRAIRPLSLALGAFGLVVGLAGLVLVGQAAARSLRAQRDDRIALRASGAPPRTIVAASIATTMVAMLVGTALAVVLAIAASPIMPAGPVSAVEAAPGIDIDATVLAVGAALILIVLTAAIVIAAIAGAPQRVARRERRVRRRSRVVASAASAGAPPSFVSGLRFAFEPDRAGGTGSTRSVMAGAAVAVAALVASITFGVSFTRLVHHPNLYGWRGDAVVTAANGYGNIPRDRAAAILDADHAVATWSGVYFGAGVIDDVATPLLGMDPGATLLPPILDGRPIENDAEIVLGGATADVLHKHIGDTVTLEGVASDGTAAPKQLRVVGIATFPAIGAVHLAHTTLGTGALVGHELVPGFDTDLTGTEHGDFGPRGIFLAFRPGVDAAAEIRHLQQTTAPLSTSAGLDVLPVQRPAEITTASSATSLPILLAGALAVAVLISLGLALGSATRHRRRELALLRTIGFTRRQLAATVGWLATSTIVVGVAVGVPAGIVVGRTLWKVFADQLDVVDTPSVPALVVVVLIVGAIALANAIAAVPARHASQIRTATLLRAE